MEVTEASLFAGLEKVKAGNHLGDIGAAISGYIKPFGYGVPIEYTGHGIGKSVHEDPYVPNVGRPHTGPILKRGMCIAIEPMVFMGKPHCHTLDDDWGVVANDHSLSAHYEHTIAITADGYKILTKED